MTATNKTTAPRPAALDGWPVELPEPSIGVHYDEEHTLISTVTVPGDQGGTMTVWTDEDGPGCHELGELYADDFVGVGQDVIEQAGEWAGRQHGVLTRMLDAELRHGLATARILAVAAGGSEDLSDDRLHGMVEHGRAALARAREDYEMATASLIARAVLKDHPGADHLGLVVDGGDHADFVSGAIAYDAAGNRLGGYRADAQYFAEDDSYEGEGVVEHLPELTADPGCAHWAVLNKAGAANPEYTIDLEKAAAWKPRADL
ncbi:hypothetical protein [Arthrobacter sp.]|uniref:hypothetical protein n=1 Tax=Arthrobacter sp. TaxID=1667 RepID=UPI003A9153D0